MALNLSILNRRSDRNGPDSLSARRARAMLRLDFIERAQAARGGFGPWLEEVSPTWQWELPHLRYLRWYLDKVTRGELKKLMVFMPPRHGKTEQGSIRYPAYRLELDPSIRIGLVTHTQKFANRVSRHCRKIVEARVEMNPSKRAAGEWETRAGGGMNAFGALGVGGGLGFNLIVIDDIIKGSKQAHSPTYRENLAESFHRDIKTRLEPSGAMIMTFTRWHQQDIGGLLLDSEEGKEWVVIKLPALAEENDPLGRPVGMALWPERWSAEYLRALQTADPWGFEALYQQNPRLRSGGMFLEEYFGPDVYVDVAPGDCRYIRYWDKACLIRGTMIETARGSIPIEQVKAGDRVLTRKGYRRVKWAGISKVADELTTVDLPNGKTLTGTPDHLVWTENRGWVELSKIRTSDYALYIPKGGDSWTSGRGRRDRQRRKRSSSTVSSTHVVRASGISQRIVGIKSGSDIGPTSSIVRCGDSIAVKSRKGIRSTTKTRTRRTTRSTTWNAYPKANISGTTGFLPVTTGPMRHDSSARGTIGSSGLGLHTGSIGVPIAGLHSSRGRFDPRSIVPCSAARGIGTPVYDIQVEDVHEFFANGVLVHNCTEGGDGATTAGVLMALSPSGTAYIVDVVRGRWNSGTRESVIDRIAAIDGPMVEIVVEQEPGSGGKESAENTVNRLRSQGYNASADKVSGDKTLRAWPIAAQCAIGKIKIVRDIPSRRWNAAFIEEMVNFPQGALKDQVDAASGAYNKLALVPIPGAVEVTGPRLGIEHNIGKMFHLDAGIIHGADEPGTIWRPEYERDWSGF